MLYVLYAIGSISYAAVRPVSPAWHRFCQAIKGTNMDALRARRGYDAGASSSDRAAQDRNLKAIGEAQDRVWMGAIVLFLLYVTLLLGFVLVFTLVWL